MFYLLLFFIVQCCFDFSRGNRVKFLSNQECCFDVMIVWCNDITILSEDFTHVNSLRLVCSNEYSINWSSWSQFLSILHIKQSRWQSSDFLKVSWRRTIIRWFTTNSCNLYIISKCAELRCDCSLELTWCFFNRKVVKCSFITKFSKESAGTFDLDAELKIWLGSEPNPMTKEFKAGDDIDQVYKILSQYTLG